MLLSGGFAFGRSVAGSRPTGLFCLQDGSKVAPRPRNVLARIFPAGRRPARNLKERLPWPGGDPRRAAPKISRKFSRMGLADLKRTVKYVTDAGEVCA